MKYIRQEILDALNKKGANKPCHRCGHNTFALIDGFARYNLSDELDQNIFGGQGVPVILIACNNCGAITSHAALALINKEEGGSNGQ